MFQAITSKSLVAALAMAGLAAIAPATSNAARVHTPQMSAAADETGSCAFFRYHGSYDPTHCGTSYRTNAQVRGSRMNVFAFAAGPAITAPAPSGGACDFSKYHGSWDPTHC